jgi:hypothetical protein
MRKSFLAALILTCLSVSTAFAQKAPDSVYGELGYTQVTIASADAGAPSMKPSALRAIVGYEMNRNFSVEGMLAMGISDGTADLATLAGTLNAKIKIDSMYGVFAKAKAEVAPGVELFGRAGYSKANLTTTVASASGSGSLDGASWGLGASYAVSPGLALAVDYMSYYNKDGGKATGPTFGVSFKF